MRKSYDFSAGQKNPYFKKLKGKKLQTTEEVSIELKDLLEKLGKKKKKKSKVGAKSKLNSKSQSETAT